MGLLLHILHPSVELRLSLIFSLAVRANRHKIRIMYYRSLLLLGGVVVLCQILCLLSQNWVCHHLIIKHQIVNWVIFGLICDSFQIDLLWLNFLVLNCSHFVWWTVRWCIQRACWVKLGDRCILDSSSSHSGLIYLKMAVLLLDWLGDWGNFIWVMILSLYQLRVTQKSSKPVIAWNLLIETPNPVLLPVSNVSQQLLLVLILSTQICESCKLWLAISFILLWQLLWLRKFLEVRKWIPLSIQVLPARLTLKLGQFGSQIAIHSLFQT
jgi:hypothetical protein